MTKLPDRHEEVLNKRMFGRFTFDESGVAFVQSNGVKIAISGPLSDGNPEELVQVLHEVFYQRLEDVSPLSEDQIEDLKQRCADLISPLRYVAYVNGPGTWRHYIDFTREGLVFDPGGATMFKGEWMARAAAVAWGEYYEEQVLIAEVSIAEGLIEIVRDDIDKESGP